MAKTHLQLAWNHARRSPFQALAALFVLTITFFVVTLIATLAYSSNRVLHYFETRPQVIAFLKDDAKKEQVDLLKSKLSSDKRVKNVKFVSKEEALEIYKKATSDNPLLSELVNPSVFPASLEFSVNNITFAQNVINEVKKNETVDQVGFTASLGESSLTDVVQRLKNISFYIKLGGGVFAALLLGTSFLVLIVIISMRMTTRRVELEILDLIGATPGFIRSPVILEALMYAVAGVFFGWLLAFLAILYATPSLISYFGEVPVLPKNPKDLLLLFSAIFTIELVIGLFLAIVGSMLAVARVKRK